jgi:carbamoyltransferase
MGAVIGLAGVRRNAASALCCDGRIVGACEQERLTRVKGVGMANGALPLEALNAVLHLGGLASSDVSSYVTAEEGIRFNGIVHTLRLDHHFAHAATAFLTSPFDDATIVVCDRHSRPELTVWTGRGREIAPADFAWTGPALATLYSAATEAMGWAAEGDEHRLEALARVGAEPSAGRATSLVRYAVQRLEIAPHYQACLSEWLRSNGQNATLSHSAEVAGGIQRRLAEVLLDILADVKQRVGGRHICLGGGLFYNTSLNTAVKASGLFDRVFVPVAPGNAGLAVGAALAGTQAAAAREIEAVSPFLGPEYSAEEIKAVLDNCKVPYQFARDQQVLDVTVDALVRGHLVGWFQGRMEWGPRALGQRSILASPLSPYVLENLNRFLKQREPYRSYGLSVGEDEADRYFDVPGASPFMQYEFDVSDAEAVRHVTPLGTRRLRVQTVGPEPGLFRKLLEAFGAAAGVSMLVNTSFNGFHEPIVCSPRDAVRVFYGTGLDMAVIGNFILRK